MAIRWLSSSTGSGITALILQGRSLPLVFAEVVVSSSFSPLWAHPPPSCTVSSPSNFAMAPLVVAQPTTAFVKRVRWLWWWAIQPLRCYSAALDGNFLLSSARAVSSKCTKCRSSFAELLLSSENSAFDLA
ncbi:hypothetical protein S83_032453 [Arachis hypogaea]